MKTSRSQKTRIVESIITVNKPKKKVKNDITTGVIENERSENILKTSKNYREKVPAICINMKNVSLVERTAKEKKRRSPMSILEF